MIGALVREGVPHRVVNVEEDEAGRELVGLLGYMEVPVTVVEDGGVVVDHWSGVRPTKAQEYGLKF